MVASAVPSLAIAYVRMKEYRAEIRKQHTMIVDVQYQCRIEV